MRLVRADRRPAGAVVPERIAGVGHPVAVGVEVEIRRQLVAGALVRAAHVPGPVGESQVVLSPVRQRPVVHRAVAVQVVAHRVELRERRHLDQPVVVEVVVAVAHPDRHQEALHHPVAAGIGRAHLHGDDAARRQRGQGQRRSGRVRRQPSRVARVRGIAQDVVVRIGERARQVDRHGAADLQRPAGQRRRHDRRPVAGRRRHVRRVHRGPGHHDAGARVAVDALGLDVEGALGHRGAEPGQGECAGSARRLQQQRRDRRRVGRRGRRAAERREPRRRRRHAARRGQIRLLQDPPAARRVVARRDRRAVGLEEDPPRPVRAVRIDRLRPVEDAAGAARFPDVDGGHADPVLRRQVAVGLAGGRDGQLPAVGAETQVALGRVGRLDDHESRVGVDLTV